MMTALWIITLVVVVLATLIAFGDFYARMLQLQLAETKPVVEEQHILQGAAACAVCGQKIQVSATIKGIGLSAASAALDPNAKNVFFLHAARPHLEASGWWVEGDRALCPSCTKGSS